MIAWKGQAISGVACLAFGLAALHVAATQRLQTANASGRCALAINASGNAVVVISNRCDVKTAATIVRLNSRARQLEASDQAKSVQIADLQRGSQEQARQLNELLAAFNSVRELAVQNSSTFEARRAQDLLEKGDVSAAVALLGQEAAVQEDKAAVLFRQQAALLRTINTRAALTALERSLALQPDNYETLVIASELAARIGLDEEARKFSDKTISIAKESVQQQPSNLYWVLELAECHRRRGQLEFRAGSLAAALSSYSKAREITGDVLLQDANNSAAKRARWASEILIADIQLNQGDVNSSFATYEMGLRAIMSLQSAEPRSDLYRHDLATTHARLGMALSTRGNFSSAKTNYEKALKLLASMQHKEYSARSTSMTEILLGDIYSAEYLFVVALKQYESALKRSMRASASDAGNHEARRDVMLAHGRIADTYLRMGSLPQALETQIRSIGLLTKLTDGNGQNFDRKRDLFVSLVKLSDIQLALNDSPQSMDALRSADAILGELLVIDSTNKQLRRDAMILAMRKALVFRRQRDFGNAFISHERSMSLVREMEAEEPSSPQVQRDLVDISLQSLLYPAPRTKHREVLTRSLELLQGLQGRGLATQDDQIRIRDINRGLASLD